MTVSGQSGRYREINHGDPKDFLHSRPSIFYQMTVQFDSSLNIFMQMTIRLAKDRPLLCNRPFWGWSTFIFLDRPLWLFYKNVWVYLIYNGNFTIEMSSKKIANFLYRNLSSRIRIKWSFVARPKTRESHFQKFLNGSHNSTVAMAMHPRTVIYGDR